VELEANSDGARSLTVRRALLGNQIADALRHDIVFGRLKAGTRLAQQQLCEKYGTSRIPVRDGLRTLLHEGLLVHDEGQHTVVAPLSKDDLLDAFVIEGMLHGLAARRVIDRATDEDIEILQELHNGMVRAAKEENHAGVAELNWQFHRLINRISGSRKLIAALRSVSLDLPKDYLVQFPGFIARSNLEHGALLAAIRGRQHDEADQIMIEHVNQSGLGLIDYLASLGVELE
jgi:DNA-binding GntR family transcriptional regulator